MAFAVWYLVSLLKTVFIFMLCRGHWLPHCAPGRVVMSREEAAKVYLDVLLGYRGGYADFLEAVEALSASDRLAIEKAVSGRLHLSGNLAKAGEVFF
jgi:hypothetical protein